VNKRKKVAMRKHRIADKKMKIKRKAQNGAGTVTPAAKRA
jgi:hypothetical protein